MPFYEKLLRILLRTEKKILQTHRLEMLLSVVQQINHAVMNHTIMQWVKYLEFMKIYSKIGYLCDKNIFLLNFRASRQG